jgi:hypothetical protein
MKRKLLILALALVGLLCAAGMGVAAYLVSRDSVAVPVTRLQPSPVELSPVRPTARKKAPRTPTRTAPETTTTVDDQGGGDGNSGHGGGGHGGGGDD